MRHSSFAQRAAGGRSDFWGAGCDDGKVDALEALVALGRMTAEQWGLVTTEQARQVGVDRASLATLTRSGLLVVVGTDVFQLAGTPPPAHLDTKVAWLQLAPDTAAWQRLDGMTGVISHSSACRLQGLGDLPVGTVHVFGDRSRPAGPDVRVHDMSRLDPAHITVVDGLPVTAVGQTVADLLRAGLDGGHVGGVVADAARLGLVDLDTLARQIAVFTSAYGLPESASGHDLISLLLANAGEQAPAR